MNGYKDIVNVLIAKGVLIDIRNNEDETPLIATASFGQHEHEDIVKSLIEEGANVYAKDEQ